MDIERLLIGFLGLGCAFSSLLYSSSAVAEQAQERQSVRFNARVTQYDNFPLNTSPGPGNGVYDTWYYYSYDNKPLREEYDFNEDGNIDKTTEWVNIKNVVIDTENKNSDQKIDRVVFDYTPFQEQNTSGHKYEFRDIDLDGIFDEFVAFTPAEFLPRQVHEPVAPSVEFLVTMLEKLNLQDEKYFVLERTYTKYAELQRLRSKEEWQVLFQKTREYLDLPSDQVLPVELKFIPEEQIQDNIETVAKAKNLKYLIINPRATRNIDDWLLAIDHEMLHLLQGQRRFNELKGKEKITWDDLVQYHLDLINSVNRGMMYNLFKCPVSSSFYNTYITFARAQYLFDELEAHLYSYQRRAFYNPIYTRDNFTYSNKVFIRAFHELIQEQGLTIPEKYIPMISEVKKALPILSRLPQEQVNAVKTMLRKTLLQKP